MSRVRIRAARSTSISSVSKTTSADSRCCDGCSIPRAAFHSRRSRRSWRRPTVTAPPSAVRCRVASRRRWHGSLPGSKAADGRRRLGEAVFADALTVVYRILFLLFAEARGLVPQWHPIYRESYTIESLRPIAESRGSPAGLWQSLQAIARLAHRGCTAGTLRVVPFNGRLFAPARRRSRSRSSSTTASCATSCWP